MNHFQKYYTVGELRAETLISADYGPKHFFRQPVSRSACDPTRQKTGPTVSADYRPKHCFRPTGDRNSLSGCMGVSVRAVPVPQRPARQQATHNNDHDD